MPSAEALEAIEAVGMEVEEDAAVLAVVVKGVTTAKAKVDEKQTILWSSGTPFVWYAHELSDKACHWNNTHSTKYHDQYVEA